MSNSINAKITSASITMADHGILTFCIRVQTAVYNFGIGGFQNGTGELGAKKWSGNGSAIVAMMKIMDVVGVTSWEDLVGKYIRIGCDDNGRWCGHKIGNIIEDKWFDIRQFFEQDDGHAIYEFDETTDEVGS